MVRTDPVGRHLVTERCQPSELDQWAPVETVGREAISRRSTWPPIEPFNAGLT